jgi:sugar phosphate isomerase/epimerase
MGKKISIGSRAFVFNQDTVLDFHTTLHKLQHMKFDGIELGSFGVHPTPMSHPTKADRLALKKEVADHGLQFSGIAPDFWQFHIISNPDPSSYLAAFLGYCEFTQDLGIKLLRVDTTSEPPDVFEKNKLDPKVGIERIVKAWDIACKMAADHGITVSWEYEPGFAFNKPSEVVEIVDAVRAKGHKNFGVMFDSCHAYMVGEVGALQPGEKETVPGGALGLLKKLEGRINHIHLIDSDGSINAHNTSTHNPFGTGKVNFDELLPALEKAKIPTDWWTIDLCFWPDAWNVTAQCKKYLDSMRSKYAA